MPERPLRVYMLQKGSLFKVEVYRGIVPEGEFGGRFIVDYCDGKTEVAYPRRPRAIVKIEDGKVESVRSGGLAERLMDRYVGCSPARRLDGHFEQTLFFRGQVLPGDLLALPEVEGVRAVETIEGLTGTETRVVVRVDRSSMFFQEE